MLSVETVPGDVVQEMLRAHLADPSVRLTDLVSEPMPDEGYSGNRVYRIRVAWGGAQPAVSRTATWVLKRWLPGGLGARLLGIDRPSEALSWQAGLLRPESLPSGVVSPIVGTWLDRGGRSAWILMEDVAGALDQYSRGTPLQPDEAVARARQVMDGLARLHAWWGRPERQAVLNVCDWLVPMERFLWCEAASCAAALGREATPGLAPGSGVTDDFREDLMAVLTWIPAGDRGRFESLLCDREPLVRALGELPRTLLHGDVDDRNLGLRLSAPGIGRGAEGPSGSELVLIDWEWMGVGVPALDVARVWATMPAVCDPAMPMPEAVFSDELPRYYLECYRAYGGVGIDPRSWRRACTVAMLAHSMSQLSFFGSMVRHDVKPVLATLARQFDTIVEGARAVLA